MAERDGPLRQVLDGYARFLRDKNLVLDKHQPYLVRWVAEFLRFARAHGGDGQDRDGAALVLGGIAGRFTPLKKLWADGGYAGERVENVKRWYGRAIRAN